MEIEFYDIEQKFSQENDVFQVGVLLYYMKYGILPYKGEDYLKEIE